MSYDYAVCKAIVFTDEGQRMLLKIRDNMNNHCQLSGAVEFTHATKGVSGSSWDMIACIDRLVEIGEFECIWDGHWVQDRIYKKVYKP